MRTPALLEGRVQSGNRWRRAGSAAVATAEACGSALRRHRIFGVALSAFVIGAILVNPLRETALEDDWSYALTVKHLLETGRYQAHDWVAANMPFQAYWGALFAGLGGYSFGVLRVSTLVLALIGLVAFYRLAREHELEPDAAGIATLALAASPLFVRLSYTFDTDVPFLACWMVALAGYTAGLARGRPMPVLLGAAAGVAAILTRQFGIALIPALVGVWALDPRRKDRLPHYTLAVLPLLGAGAWQFYAALADAHWGILVSRSAEARYLADPWQAALRLVWRPAVVLYYLALFSLALLPVLALRLGVARRPHAAADRRAILLIGAYLLAAPLLGSLALNLPVLMPYIPWNFSPVGESLAASAGLTAVTFAGALYLGWVLYLRYVRRDGPIAPQHALLDLATFFLLAQHLIFYKMGDRYLLDLIPLALIALARHIRGDLARRLRLALLAGLVVCAGSLVWTRGILAYQEARWQAAETARLSGIDARMIYGPWAWICYYRFPDYLAYIRRGVPDDQGLSMFDDWLPAQERQAHYYVVVSRTRPPAERWKVTGDVPFRDIIFRASHAYLVRRLDLAE
jgi:4-amino-4-deoxy-L-arabinose transferase-like glycosyltransferase